jgi:DoxX
MTLNNILRTGESGWTILVRFLVGLVVFLPEGTQKLIFANVLGAGRFAKIGIPFPNVMAPFVGTVEIVCGSLIILGLLTRARRGAPDYHHDRGSGVDKSSDPAGTRCVDISPGSGYQTNRFLEHAARIARGPHDVAWLHLPFHRRCRPLVAGRSSGAIAAQPSILLLEA